MKEDLLKNRTVEKLEGTGVTTKWQNRLVHTDYVTLVFPRESKESSIIPYCIGVMDGEDFEVLNVDFEEREMKFLRKKNE